MGQLLPWLLFTTVPLSGALIAQFVFAPSRKWKDWYKALAKPWFTPPSAAFGPVWTFLYITMGIAAKLIYDQSKHSFLTPPLLLFYTQLLVNWSWSPIFFGMKRIGLSLGVIAILWLLVLATTIAFFAKSPEAGGLLVPHLCWVSLASALNYKIFTLNRNKEQDHRE